jgi:gliding motility-associated-like protein
VALATADDGNGDRAVRSKSGLDRIGTAVMPNSGVSKKISMFWNNGVDWIKMGGDVDQNNQVVTMHTSRLGSYQLRQAGQLGDASLVQVYPRIFTPNGDGANDVVIFQFGEISSDSGSLSGEIFDITGGKVADLKPGPDPNTTLKWDGKSSGGAVVPAGIYVYQIHANGTRVNGTVVVAK